MRKFNELTDAEKLEKIYSRAYNKCQDSIDTIIGMVQGDREELERYRDYLEFNEDMMEYLANRAPTPDEREMLNQYGVHVHSRRMRS